MVLMLEVAPSFNAIGPNVSRECNRTTHFSFLSPLGTSIPTRMGVWGRCMESVVAIHMNGCVCTGRLRVQAGTDLFNGSLPRVRCLLRICPPLLLRQEILDSVA